ncbi:MAG: hypothetical protein MZV63_45585 [Marinilabiliales bacterium]|nr:hypothetical protein [Marinilabiliales bacterium]
MKARVMQACMMPATGQQEQTIEYFSFTEVLNPEFNVEILFELITLFPQHITIHHTWFPKHKPA